MQATKPLILLALILAGCKHPQKAVAPVLPHYEPSAKNQYEAKPARHWDCEPNLDPRPGDVQIDCEAGKGRGK